MHTTSPTLLDKLRHSDSDGWPRFVDLYTPLLYYWARRMGLNGTEVDDLVQDVFIKLLQELPKFRYDQGKTFRGWLRTVCTRHWKDYQKKRANQPAQAGDADPNELPAPDKWEQFWNQDYNALVVGQALQIIAADFDSKTQSIIEEVVMKNRSVEDVASQLGLTPNAVSSRKRRVLRKLKQVLGDCVE